MPHVQINFDDIIFEREVYSYCNSPKFKCPNYGTSWSCPPASHYLEEEVSKFKIFYLIYYKFDIETYIKKIQEEHPEKSEEKIKFSLYTSNFENDKASEEIKKFLKEYDEPYEESLVIWSEKCKFCENEGEQCTYMSEIPCRYPEKLTHSMTGAGINTTSTVKNLDFDIEWPPVKSSYRFGLVCFK